MKIKDIKTFCVDCFRTNWVFVKVYTDEGIDGVGEATLEYKEKALVGAVEHIKEVIVGQNPLNIEKIWHDTYRDAYWRGGAVLMSALSAVEMRCGIFWEKVSMCRCTNFWAEKSMIRSEYMLTVGSQEQKNLKNLLRKQKLPLNAVLRQ